VHLGKGLMNSSPGQALFGFLLAWYIRLVTRTTRWNIQNGKILTDLLSRGRGFILITWHAGWPNTKSTRPTKTLHSLVSRHGDGELVARTLRHFGMVMVRGSTQRGGKDYEPDRQKGGAAAMRRMLKLLRDGQVIGLTPDGPRGPARQLSAGVISLAQMSGAPIVAVSIVTERHRRLRSWDKFRIALPFSRGAMVFARPISVERRLGEPAREAARLRVEAAMNQVTDTAGLGFGDLP